MLDPFSPQSDRQRARRASDDRWIQQFIAVVKRGRGDRLKVTPDTFSGCSGTASRRSRTGSSTTSAALDHVARATSSGETVIDYATRKPRRAAGPAAGTAVGSGRRARAARTGNAIALTGALRDCDDARQTRIATPEAEAGNGSSLRAGRRPRRFGPHAGRSAGRQPGRLAHAADRRQLRRRSRACNRRTGCPSRSTASATTLATTCPVQVVILRQHDVGQLLVRCGGPAAAPSRPEPARRRRHHRRCAALRSGWSPARAGEFDQFSTLSSAASPVFTPRRGRRRLRARRGRSAADDCSRGIRPSWVSASCSWRQRAELAEDLRRGRGGTQADRSSARGRPRPGRAGDSRILFTFSSSVALVKG